MIGRGIACFLAAILLSVVASLGRAEAWPERPIRFVVSASVGSSFDALFFVVGARLKDRLG